MACSFVGVSVSTSYPLLALMTFILGMSSGTYVTAGYTLAALLILTAGYFLPHHVINKLALISR